MCIIFVLTTPYKIVEVKGELELITRERQCLPTAYSTGWEPPDEECFYIDKWKLCNGYAVIKYNGRKYCMVDGNIELPDECAEENINVFEEISDYIY